MYGRVDRNITPIDLVKKQRDLIEQSLVGAQNQHTEAVAQVTYYAQEIEHFRKMLYMFDDFLEGKIDVE